MLNQDYTAKLLNLEDVIVTNAPHNMGGSYKGLLFTANHNRSITDDELMGMNAVRVDNWKEVYELIHGYQVHSEKKSKGGIK